MTGARILLAMLGASLTIASNAFAQDERQCMAPVAITEAIVHDAAFYDFQSFVGDGAAPAFVLGHLSPTRDREDAQDVHGTAVFVREGDQWRAFLPRPGESVIAAYVARESGAFILVTQWQSEGPGQSWTLLRSSDGLATGACTDIRFPETLNNPSWANEALDLVDLDINARGRGEIIAHAETDDDGPLWYAYRTSDHGARWSNPRRLRSERQARSGIYTPIDLDADASPDLIAALQAYAAGR
ncbi:hypothetical protein U91I_01795 [alpha proteobacterium U9-1i]|nr:hypothetical protein U91I_01795 [alpha proteobacterium U9-1i]